MTECKILTKANKRKLEVTVKKLQRYCHVLGCKEYWLCPRDHSECSKKLDLDTAIAQEAQRDIICLINCIDAEFKPKIIIERIRVIDETRDILGYHKDKYKKLDSIMDITFGNIIDIVYGKIMAYKQEKRNEDRC